MTEKTERTPKRLSISQKELKARTRHRNKKPKFLRAESWKYDRFSLSWRRPRGLDNKIRRKIKGWPVGVSCGYKGPKNARGLHPSGYREVIVNNVQDLSTIDANIQAARIAHTVGKRKRALIIAEAKALNIKILNIKISKETKTKETEEEAPEMEENETEQTEEVEEKEEAPKAEKKAKPKPKKEKAPKKTKPKATKKKGDAKQ